MRFTLFAFAVGFVVIGCGQPKPQATTQPEPTPASAPVLGLDTKQTAGPFEVTLKSSVSQPKASGIDLIAEVSQDGKPLDKADVKAELVMPAMREMGSTVIHLKPAGIGLYRGNGDLPMPGQWNALLFVQGSDGRKGSATYTFEAK